MSNTVKPEEIHRFNKISPQWWDEQGPFKPLHQMNPARVQFIVEGIRAHFNQEQLEGLTILDVGCGGGLVTEPLARLGATVTGIDASLDAIATARAHAEIMELGITYENAAPEALIGHQIADVIIALEILEHVESVPEFISVCKKLLKPGGLIIFSTLNKTWKAWAVAIIGAEYILRWLPKGTHTWEQFIAPATLQQHVENEGLRIKKIRGLTFNPLAQSWSLSRDLDINYIVSCA